MGQDCTLDCEITEYYENNNGERRDLVRDPFIPPFLPAALSLEGCPSPCSRGGSLVKGESHPPWK